MAFHGAAAKLGSMLSTPRSPSRRQSVSLPESAYVDAEEQMLHENAELVRAAKRGDLSAVQRQWKVLPGPNAFYKDGRDKYTLLHLACNHGHESLVRWLLGKKRVVCEVRDGQLWTPLHLATINEHLDIVVLLAKKGANVNARNSDRTAVLHYLVRKELDERRLRTLEVLLRHGLLIDPKNRFDETPLQAAVARGRTDTAAWLLKNGAKVNAVNKFGETALTQAVVVRDEAMVLLLLEHGADPTYEVPTAQLDVPGTDAPPPSPKLTQLLDDYRKRWRERTAQHAELDAQWMRQSLAERLRQSPLVHSSVALLPPATLQACLEALQPIANAWDGWTLDVDEPHRPSTEHLTALQYAAAPYLHRFHERARDHLNFVGALMLGVKDAAPEPAIISIARDELFEGEYETLLWRLRGTQRLYLPAELVQNVREAAKRLARYLKEYYAAQMGAEARVAVALELAPQTDTFREALVTLEARDPALPRQMSVGLLYAKAGQTSEEELFDNEMRDASATFHDFLELLGERVVLREHAGYRGDLDTSGKNLTGSHAVFAREAGYEVMFHTAPLLPSQRDEEGQQMMRKRFIGNDISTVVFQDGGTFPCTIRSQFLHIYLVVAPLLIERAMHYRVAVVRRTEVEPYGPPVASPSVVVAGEQARQFLLTKLINGHLAALRSPKLSRLLVLGPKEQTFRELIAQHCKASDVHKALTSKA